MSSSTQSLRVVLALESSGPGGAENMVVHLAAALRDLGHQPRIATMHEGWMTERARQIGLPVWVMPQRTGVDPAWVVRLTRRLRREAIDVFHSHEFAMNVFGGAAAVLARVRSAATIHGKHWIVDRGRRTFAYRMLDRAGVAIVAVSDDLANYLARGLGVPRTRIHLVHNGIPIPPLAKLQDRQEARRAAGLPTDTPLVLAVGNLYPVKDHATLLRAVTDVPRAHVAIAGRGDEEVNLRRLALDLGIEDRVHLLGLRDDVARLLQAADVFVQPSRSEGLPLAILEAMAAGLPVVATRVGGMAEAIIDGESGILVEPGQPDALARALRALLSDTPTRTRIGRSAHLRACAEFSVETMARRYVELYRAL